MAKLNVTIKSFKDAIGNKFICQFLDKDNNLIPRFQQNQEFFVNDTMSPQQLTFDLPDGPYIYDYLKIRVYSQSVGSKRFIDIDYYGIAVDCDSTGAPIFIPGQPVITTTVGNGGQQTTTIQQTTQFIPQQRIVSLCADSGCFITGITSLNENVQFRLSRRIGPNYVQVENWTNGVVPFSNFISNCVNLGGIQTANRIRAYGNIGAGQYLIEVRPVSTGIITSVEMSVACGSSSTTVPTGNTTTVPTGNTTTVGTTLPIPDGTTSNNPMSVIAGPQPSYNGTLSSATHQNNPSIMNIEIASYNSQTKKLKFRFQTLAEQGNRSTKILVNSLRPALTKQQFEEREWKVENGPYLVQSFFADANDNQFQRDQYRGSYSMLVIN